MATFLFQFEKMSLYCCNVVTGASSIPSAGPGQAAPSFQQSPFQTASATVPSATPFPNHARIPNNVPKGGKGGKHGKLFIMWSSLKVVSYI